MLVKNYFSCEENQHHKVSWDYQNKYTLILETGSRNAKQIHDTNLIKLQNNCYNAPINIFVQMFSYICIPNGYLRMEFLSQRMHILKCGRDHQLILQRGCVNLNFTINVVSFSCSIASPSYGINGCFHFSLSSR